MSEFIGSRISLISKSDIRYVGILHEINSENSTVALEQVVSYGTEGRRGDPAKEIAAADNVYEYIVFRGSDVKDLRIEEPAKPQQPAPQVPDDPAILTSTARPPAPAQSLQQQQPQQPQQLQQSQFPQGVHPYYQQNSQLPRYGGYPPYGGYFPGYHPMGPPGSQQFIPPNLQQQQFPRQMPPGQAPIGPTSRPQPPSHVSQAPQVSQPIGQPTAARGSTPFSQNQNLQQQQAQHTPTKVQSLPEQVPNKPSTPAAISQPSPVPPVAVEEPEERKPATSTPVKSETSPTSTSPGPTTQARQQTPKLISNTLTAPKGHGGVVPALPLTGSGQPSPPIPSSSPVPAIDKPADIEPSIAEAKTTAALNETSAVVEQLAQKLSQHRLSSAQQSSDSATRSEAQRSNRPPNSRGRGGFRGGYHAPRKVEIPAADFDFESANAKFNKQDLIKEVIAAEETTSSVANGNGTLNGHKSPDERENILQPPEQPYYSRQTSFFDNISCESKERAEVRDTEKRAWRGEEVKKNIETFGQGSVDGGFHRYVRGGGYRGGRGRGGYNRGSGGGYRGGRGYYRGASSGVSTQNHQ